MSKILRRPMFRGGGKVSSYGNGIATGLANGGMTSKRGLVDGPGGYAGILTLQDILSQTNKNMTGGEILAYANRNNIDLGNNFKINEKSMFTQNEPVGMGNIGASPSDVASAIANPVFREEEEFEEEVNASGDVVFKLDKNEQRIPIEKIDYSNNLSLAENIAIARDIERDQQGADLNLNEKFETSTTNILDERDGDKKIKGYSNMTGDPAQFTVEDELTDFNALKEKEGSKDLESIIDGDSDEDIQNMADRYFKLMGGDKARGQDISDMLLRYSGAEGNTVGEKFQNFTKEESKVKSRTEGIKSKASGFAIQQDAQMKILQKKLDSAEGIAEKNLIAAEMRSLNKQYSPSITQKDINYGKSLKKGSADHTMYLRKNKLAPTLSSEITSKSQLGTPMFSGEVNALGPIYYNNWQGIFTPGQSKGDGVYLDVENKKIIKFNGGELTSEEKIAIQ